MFKLLKGLFKKKVLIYTAFGNEDYFKVVGRLASKGIKYHTRSPFDARGRHDYFADRMRQYDIYVYQEDENKALSAIHHRH